MLALFVAVIGACLGSFSTLLIWRLHSDEKGIFCGRSRCTKCGKTLKVRHLVPLFSWLFLQGRCAFCRARISAFYPLTEFAFSLVYFLLSQKFYSQQNFLPVLIVAFFALVLLFYDAKFREVDRRISWTAIAFALVWSFFRDLPSLDFLIGGVGAFLFYFVQYFYSKNWRSRLWVGAGDMELGIFMGLVLGWKYLILALFLAYILGLIWVGVLFFFPKTKISWNTKVPLGAFLMPMLLAFLYEGEKIWQWYLHLLLP